MHLPKDCQHYQKEKRGSHGTEPKRNPKRKRTSEIATSEEELLLISENSEVNLVGDESTWVVDSGASFHLTPDKGFFSSYTVGDHGFVKMGNEGCERCRAEAS